MLFGYLLRPSPTRKRENDFFMCRSNVLRRLTYCRGILKQKQNVRWVGAECQAGAYRRISRSKRGFQQLLPFRKESSACLLLRHASEKYTEARLGSIGCSNYRGERRSPPQRFARLTRPCSRSGIGRRGSRPVLSPPPGWRPRLTRNRATRNRPWM